MIYEVSIAEKTYRVELERLESGWQCRLDGRELPVDAAAGEDGVLSLLMAGKSYEVKQTPNIHQSMELVVVDYFPGATGTPSANKWYVVADPNMCPTIEMGFYQGRTDPELFTQQDPTIGSMFNADKVTYKIRHIYNGAVLDFRGFYRNGIP